MELIKKRFGKKKYTEKVLNYKEFAEFKKLHPEFNTSVKEVKLLSELILKEYYSEILENPDGVGLANHMGEISIKFTNGVITTNQKVNQEFGIKTEFLNLTTNGKVGKVTWNKINHIKQNRHLKLLCFQPYTQLSKDAKVEILKNSNKFNNAKVNGKNN